jgi:hypothetical protein
VDLFRIRARRNHPVVFQLAVVAVEHQIDTRVHFSQRHFAVVGDVGPPFRRIVADEIIADTRLFIQGLESRLGIRADQLHPLHRPFAAGKYGFLRRHKQRIARSTSEKLHAPINLALVRLKAERQSAISVAQVARRRQRQANYKQRKTESVHFVSLATVILVMKRTYGVPFHASPPN